MVILFIFLIILNIWIYYTITFCRFTFYFYRLWQNKWIGGKGSSLMRQIYKRFFPKLKNYEIKLKKERTSEQCPEFDKKFGKFERIFSLIPKFSRINWVVSLCMEMILCFHLSLLCSRKSPQLGIVSKSKIFAFFFTVDCSSQVNLLHSVVI
jgi:hypothetical protein